MTYKFSQDHLELWFGAIRMCRGSNNNPTARQFVAAYKRLLLRSSIGGNRGDVYKMDNTEMRLSNVALARKYDLDGKIPVVSDHDYAKTATVSANTEGSSEFYVI